MPNKFVYLLKMFALEIWLAILIFFQLSGLALIIVGALIKSKYGTYLSFANAQYADAAIFIIVVGVIVFVVAFMGCCGAIKENYCMITTFATFMVIIFILEVAAGAMSLAYKKKVTILE